VTNVGKTLLKGHALRHEGHAWYDADGQYVGDYGRRVYSGNLRAKCSCGAVSEPNISTKAARQWHREHKDSLR
jgi:hypothetical protein